MNERIRELAEQANNAISGNAFSMARYNEKFAELIVAECMEVSLKYSHRDDDMGAIIARQIKQHFGVEE